MYHTASFTPPDLETMNGLLPAFAFTALVDSGDLRAVYAARQRSLDRDVAIKILSPEVSESPKFRRSFEITARTMARLNHPNLIGVFDSGHVDDMLYFVLEFIPGKSLARSARGQRVELSQTLHLIEGISSGLAHAHAHGVVHGALEPSVILLNQKAEPKIGNFGFSFSADPLGGGENPYIAPEVLDGTAEPDFRADVYAVGAILYELLTGTPHRAGAPAPSTLSKCGPNLDAIWHKATHPDPNQRFAGMHEFHQAISDLIHGPATVSPPKQAKAVGPVAPGRVPVPHAPPTTRVQARAARRAGTDWSLIRNFLIIGAILCAIYFAWGAYQKNAQKESQIREQAARQAEKEKQAIQDARKKSDELKSLQTGHPTHANPVRPAPVETKIESPYDSLVRLSTALASGRRDEMPVGSVENGESVYFLVRKPMTWVEASLFAEQIGAHLAIPSVGADLQWLISNVAQKHAFWIGAARSGASNWVLADGKPWKPVKEPGGTGFYVGVDKDGFLRVSDGKARLPFVIQWHRDGKNPGSLDAVLTKTRESLGKSGPVFPPGTRNFGPRNFLFVAREVGWNEAVSLAEKAGGHLAVTTTAGEIAAVEEITNELPSDRRIWLGASLKDQRWTWITGEPWQVAKWGNDAEKETPDTALILRPGKSWSSFNVSQSASGFIIEWSQDAKSNPAITTKPGATAPVTGTVDVDALSRKAKELITAADLKRTQQLAANSRKLASDLDLYLRNLPGNGREWQSEVDSIKNSIADSRIPSTILESGDVRTNTVIDGIVKYGLRKQNEIDYEFFAYAVKLHGAYIAKIRESIAQAQQVGQSLLAKSLNNTLAAAEKPEAWIQSFGVEPKPETRPADRGESENQDGHEMNGDGENPAPPQNNDGGGLIE